jgi:hypothetical protein
LISIRPLPDHQKLPSRGPAFDLVLLMTSAPMITPPGGLPG